MARQKNLLNGWLLLDKPYGISSAKAVAEVKYHLKPQKIGHAGTLDPLASGVLPLALGEATKVIHFMMDAKKTYSFTVSWGEERSTDDAEGDVVASSPNRPALAAIKQALEGFTGVIRQVPPVYSAIKVGGQRAYALARAGEAPEMTEREVTIYDIKILLDSPGESTLFEVTCSKGTYVRAIARDLGRLLGCFAYVSTLRRISVGKFTEKDAISLANLKELVHNAPPNYGLLPVESVLDDILALQADSNIVAKLRHGREIALDIFPGVSLHENMQCAVESEGKLVAMCRVEQGVLRPARVFNY